MMRLCFALLALLAAPAQADPRFTNRAATLANPPIYGGEWEHFVGGGVAIFDCDADARPDLFVAGGTNPAHLLRNTSAPGGEVAYGPVDIAETLGVTGAYPIDINGDGILDLAVLRVGPDQFWQGLGDCKFRDATADWGLTNGDRWSTAFTATWEAGQDWPTLVIGHYVDRNRPDGPFEACDDNSLYRPTPQGYGEETTISPGYCALSMLISDWTRSGTPDLRISNDRHYYVRGGYEEMWHLNPLAPYDPAEWPRISLWGMGIASRDITGDGLPEVMMTSMGDQLLQINRGGRMENAPFGIGTYAHQPYLGDDGRPSTGWHAEFGDMDNDGRDDLFIAKGNVDQMPSNAMRDPNNLLMQGADGVFVETGAQAGIATLDRSRGAGLVDLNADGRLDIVVVNRRAPMEIWENQGDAGNWLSVLLQGAGRNTQAVGAWVELRVGERVQAREVTVGGGHVSGQAGPLHFGLGTADAGDIRVIWPDGTVGDWQAVQANTPITLTAPN
ncbi:Repeat domain-containing protein [Pseudorhodobacter antarcticus]|uniref:Repeat domain-containing protein n=2 Tax=Pseudorhodobacter antarcticus TaxID=1077947 RepID=A0A1H8E766_9RHOB|nr:CRTAC1 family protein [Pseudorhodobacter antarcticus]SEN15411.1 Repeat domain-containing protein [Pseudorhodobacter antarcticus]